MRLFYLSSLMVFSFLLFTSCKHEFDIVIKNGNILDGSGREAYIGDIGIMGNQITMIGDIPSSHAEKVIDAAGKTVSPGFIDVHSHAGRGLVHSDRSDGRILLTQGITTVIINPDGGGPIDIQQQDSALMHDGIGVNVIQMVPHGSVRREIMGMENRLASEKELEEMKKLVKQGMEQGAFGLSSGPFYTPGSYSDTRELVEVSKAITPYNGVYTSHIRDESNYTIGLEAAVDEVITVAREANITGIVTHIKALGPPVWGKSKVIIEKIEKARAEGVSIYADQYPYIASATGLGAALLPRQAFAGGRKALKRRMNDLDTMIEIKEKMIENLERRGGAERIQFRYYDTDTMVQGRTLANVSSKWDMSPVDAAYKMLLNSSGTGIVSFNMDENDVNRFMEQDWTMTCSDGSYPKWNQGVPHPRFIGSFPRKIRKYVLEDKIITLEHAIRSMTGLSADVFQIKDRGYIRKGYAADIAIFDPAELIDKATFTDPFQYSEGIDYLIINGQIAIENQTFNDIRSGIILKRN